MAWTTPRTWTTTELVTASIMNTHVRDNLAAAFPNGTDWIAWTPTLTNLTLGNGAVVARYQLAGDTCNFRFRFTLGSTSAVGSGPRFSVPVAPSATYVDSVDQIGLMAATDTGTATYPGFANFGDTLTTVRPFGIVTSAANGTMLSITSTAPFTWGTTDVLAVSGTYEVA